MHANDDSSLQLITRSVWPTAYPISLSSAECGHWWGDILRDSKQQKKYFEDKSLQKAAKNNIFLDFFFYLCEDLLEK